MHRAWSFTLVGPSGIGSDVTLNSAAPAPVRVRGDLVGMPPRNRQGSRELPGLRSSESQVCATDGVQPPPGLPGAIAHDRSRGYDEPIHR